MTISIGLMQRAVVGTSEARSGPIIQCNNEDVHDILEAIARPKLKSTTIGVIMPNGDENASHVKGYDMLDV